MNFIAGPGKNHKDAASVRATHPIPTSCGIYYFEVKVISKGRDGYVECSLLFDLCKCNWFVFSLRDGHCYFLSLRRRICIWLPDFTYFAAVH